MSSASSSEIAVSVRGLSKSYTIAHEAQTHTLASEAFLHSLKNLGRKAPQRETFWALTDVSFDIAKGDVVGIIGRNGAGKSTLLKVLSRITEPTTGQIELYGRVGSLLEVGTGFHPELTGRENIFLNGAVLGMSRREIAKHFEAIVEFAGVEKFLDTPVKRYSSGMYVRLAFAVAAHLEPEILIVDEVLAVGDAEFQKKCLGKMQDVAAHGRTVLFVSHHMQSISLLCKKALYLDRGTLSFMGNTADAIDRYLGSAKNVNTTVNGDFTRREGTGQYRYTSVAPTKDYFSSGEEKVINFRIECQIPDNSHYYISCLIVNADELIVAQIDGRLVGHSVAGNSDYEGSIRLKTPWLKPGEYRVDAFIFNHGIIDKLDNACRLNVIPVFPYSVTTEPGATEMGLVCSDFAIEDASVRSLPDFASEQAFGVYR